MDMDYTPAPERKTPKFNWAVFLGSLILAVAVMIAGRWIADIIRNTAVPPSNYINASNDVSIKSGDFLNDYEAAEYLCIDYDTLMEWVESGALDRTYTVASYVSVVEMHIGEDVTEVSYSRQEGLITDGVDDPLVERYQVDQYIFSKAKLMEYMNNLISPVESTTEDPA